MTGYERIARSAGRRMVLNELQQHASRYLLLGLGLSLLLIVLDRLLGLGLNPILIGAAPPTAAVALACLNAWTHRPTPLQALAHVDGVMRLHDTLGSASAVGEMRSDRPVPPTVQAMRELTSRRAEELAATVPVRRAIPLRSTERWWVTGFFAVAVAATLFFLPTFDLLAKEPSEEETQAQARAVEQRAQAAEAVQSMQEALEETAAVNDDPLLQEQLERLDRLDQELTTARNSDSLLKETAGEFHELADALDRRTDESRRRFAQESKRFERLPQPERQEARDLAEALQREDMQRAIETLREMERRLDGLPEAEREQLAKDLRTLADHLNEPEAMDAPPEEAQTPRDAAAEYLREQGLSEPDAAEIADLPDEESMRQALEDRGFDPMTADRLAEQAMEEREQRQAAEAAEESMRNLAEALNETADEVEEPPGAEPQESPPEGSTDPADPPEASSASDDQPETPGEEASPPTDQEQSAEGAGDQQGTESAPTSDEQPTDRMEGQNLGGEGEERLGDQGEESTPEESEDAQPNTESAGDAEPPEGEEAIDQEGGTTETGEGTEPPTDPQTGEEGTQDPTGGEREGADPGQETDDESPPGTEEEPTGTETSEPGDAPPPAAEEPPTGETTDPAGDAPPEDGTPPDAGPEDPPSDQGTGDQPPGGEEPPPPPDGREDITLVDPDPTAGDETEGSDGPEQPGASPPPPTDAGEADPGETTTPPNPGGEATPPGGQTEPGDPTGPSATDPGQGGGGDPTPDSTGVNRLIDELERLQKEREEAENQRELSAEARRRAEEMMNSLSPQERERLLQWAQQYRNQTKLADQAPGARTDFETEALDIRRSGEEDRVAAEWDRDPEPGEGTSTRPVSGAPNTADQIKQAQQAADRAIEEQAFPSRFSNVVRRYFQRARESAEKAEETAKDAGAATESSESSGSE